MGLKNLFQKKKQPLGHEEGLSLHEEEQKKFHVQQVFKFDKKTKTMEERYLIVYEDGIKIHDFHSNDVVQSLPWTTMKWFEVHPHTKQFHIQTLSGIKADRLRFDTKQAVTIHNTCELYLKRFIRNKKLKLDGAPKVFNDVMCRTPPRPPPLPPKELNLRALSDSAALSPSFNSPAFRDSSAVPRASLSDSLGWSTSSLGASTSSVSSGLGPSPGPTRRAPTLSGLRTSSTSNSSKKAFQPILGPLVNWEEDDDSLTASMGGMILGGGQEEDESSYQSKSTPQMRYNQSLVF